MGYQDIRTRYYLFARIIVFVALIGFGVLVFANIEQGPTHLTFSLIAFGIGVAALLVTVLQSITISKQIQITEKAAREVRETGEQLKDLVRNNMRLEHEVEEDIQLDHQIIEVLKEHGVGDNDEIRHDVAYRIAKKIKKSHHKS